MNGGGGGEEREAGMAGRWIDYTVTKEDINMPSTTTWTLKTSIEPWPCKNS